MKKTYLECGRVCNAHGVRGVLKVEPWCDSPKVLAMQKHVFFAERDGSYRECKILGASVSGQGVLLTLEGVDSREAAIALKNVILYLHRDDIPLRPGAMLVQDMIGLSVIDANSGRVYGEIAAVEDAPRGKLYTVRTSGADVLFPHVDEFIREIVPDKGMFITPIPGFFEES